MKESTGHEEKSQIVWDIDTPDGPDAPAEEAPAAEPPVVETPAAEAPAVEAPTEEKKDEWMIGEELKD